MSLYVVAELRRRSIRLQSIRKAETWLRDDRGYERPFATVQLFTAGKEILVRLATAVPEDEAALAQLHRASFPDDRRRQVREPAPSGWPAADGDVLVSASRGGQQAIEEAFQVVLQAVDYEDEKAIRWRPNAHVEVSPHRQFGAPCVAGTGIQTSTIYAFLLAGEQPAKIAELYELPVERVNGAASWEKSLALAG